jgi:pyruvate formate lyase activating enzyme
MKKMQSFEPAVLWEPLADKKVHCFLCNWNCHIDDGKLGHCRVRKNIDGRLFSLNYDKVCSANPDPVEKKPLFHFQPGSRTFSIAAPGCNFQCEFCQNWQISQVALDEPDLEGQAIDPKELVDAAMKTGCSSMAYTYTEPTIFMELCAACAKPAKEKSLKNIFVSNGYMTIPAIEYAKDWLDAINVDLKAFSETYYRKLCKASLEPVLETITHIARNTNIWMEITTLLIPDENDSEEELKQLTSFLVNQVGPDVPWHVSRFYPNYHYLDSTPTPSESLLRAYEIGTSAGIKFIYIGNVPGGGHENTLCPECGKLLIKRAGYTITKNEITNGRCPACGIQIPGVF